MGAPAWGSRGGGDRPRLLRMTPLRHSFAAPASPPAPPPRTHDYASDADTNKKGNLLQPIRTSGYLQLILDSNSLTGWFLEIPIYEL